MSQNIIFYFNQLTDKLWFKPLIFCLLSIMGALVAELADGTFLTDIAPDIKYESLDDLLSTLSNSMLVSKHSVNHVPQVSFSTLSLQQKRYVESEIF